MGIFPNYFSERIGQFWQLIWHSFFSSTTLVFTIAIIAFRTIIAYRARINSDSFWVIKRPGTYNEEERKVMIHWSRAPPQGVFQPAQPHEVPPVEHNSIYNPKENTMLSVWRKLANVAVAVEVVGDFLWILALLLPMDPGAKRFALTIAVALTGVGSALILAYAFTRQPPVPAPPVVPAPFLGTRTGIQGALQGATIGVLVAILAIAIMWAPLVPPAAVWWTLLLLWAMSVSADIFASIKLLTS